MNGRLKVNLKAALGLAGLHQADLAHLANMHESRLSYGIWDTKPFTQDERGRILRVFAARGFAFSERWLFATPRAPARATVLETELARDATHSEENLVVVAT